jgi:hypothetical protein
MPAALCEGCFGYVFFGAGSMNRIILFLAIGLTLSLNTSAFALSDDVATVGLWQMESIYYDSSNMPWVADDDSQNAGRNHDMILWRAGLNETPPTVVAGYDNNAFLFEGLQYADCATFWSSSYTEFKLDYMIYITSVPTELGAAITYHFSAPIFSLNVWPSADGIAANNYMKFELITTNAGTDTTISSSIIVGDLKNRWLHVVCSYDASKHYSFSITDMSTNTTRSATQTGAYLMKSASGGVNFGSTSPSLGSKPNNRNFCGMVDCMKISNKVVTPHYSYTPVPATGSTIYVRPEGLAWSKGLVALGSDVFFGTSSSAVTAATKPAFDIDGSTIIDFSDFAILAGQWQQAPGWPSADINKSGIVNYVDLYQLMNNWLTSTTGAYPLFLGSTTGNTMAYPALLPSKTYYWRVDSVNGSENIKGSTWSFTTGSAATSGPYPATGATSVAVDANTVNLTWVAGFNATSYNIYFGTAATPPLVTTVTARTYAASGLAPSTKYYWRVDAVSGSGTTTGTIWNFTTGTISAINPSPATAATSVTFPLLGVDLSWTSTFKPGSYNVYFGTMNPPVYVGSTTQPSFRSPAVIQNKLYYWRVDCVSVFGTVTGPVWNLTTATPAFPQAEGFGRFAKGGRGGTIYHVTTLADSGAGSFRDALSAGNRTIVFDVGGQIINTARLGVSASNITIAGQTAPGQGISVAPGISFTGSNIIMRYIRFRYTLDTIQDDCVTINSSCQNIIFDHISASWATDEVLSITGAPNITVQWTMVTEGSNALNHSKGSLLEMPVLSWHHNIYAHNSDRNPKNKGTFDYRNNVVYNWGIQQYIAGGNTSAQCYANAVGNYYIAGVDSLNPQYMVIGGNNNYHLYLYDNRLDSNCNGVLDGVDLGLAMVDPAGMPIMMNVPYEFPPVTTTSPEIAYTQVLANAGCSLSRDSIDTRVVNSIINQTGSIISDYRGNGGLGTITGGTPPLDTDGDGMPDAWEDAHGLNKTSAADANIVGADGYTNLENYLNSLAVYP